MATIFQHRHYEAIAKEIRESIYGYKTRKMIMNFHIGIFKPDNDKFDEKRFRKACGVE